MTTGSRIHEKIAAYARGDVLLNCTAAGGQFLATEYHGVQSAAAFDASQGVRGLGGIPGLTEILLELEALGLVDLSTITDRPFR